MKKFDILSPDGFSIKPTGFFNKPETAWKYFETWKRRFELQGYYSTGSRERIPLDVLKDYCKLISK
jgi:hypothetical protein